MTGSEPVRVLRLCASYHDLTYAECTIPERCVDRLCSICHQMVHYDPKVNTQSMFPYPVVEKIVGTCCMSLEIDTIERHS